MFYDTSSDLATTGASGEEIHSVWEQDEDIIDHVIFVIHGIGQQTERFGYFEQHMETIRETISEVLKARMPDSDVRIQLIPIEWHKYIHEQTDERLNNISLQTIPGMRMINNDYMMDALYYLAKDRQQSIITHVTQTFNDAYHDFIDSHPSFDGNIGIFGYSLGGLITWDILAHQRSIGSMEEQAQLDKMGLDVPHLDFKPQFLFGVGCPLGAFLNIRNQDPKLYHPDSSTIFENIYHPCDPLAYRVEPLYHTDCRHHDSIRVEAGMPADSNTPLLDSLTGWITSWFKKLNNDISEQQNSSSLLATGAPNFWTPHRPPVNVNNTVSMNTPSRIATSCNSNHTDNRSQSATLPPIDCPLNELRDASPLTLNVDDDGMNTGKNNEPSDRTTLLSSVGALFQYISPRTSFDRDSAIGSDIEEDEEEGDSIKLNDPLDTTSTNNQKINKMTISTTKNTTINNNDNSRPTNKLTSTSPTLAHGVAANPLNASSPHMIYRRQSQIYDSITSQCWMQRKRRRSSPILNAAIDLSSPISSLEQDATLLNTLPGGRRLDYELQVEPMFGGMVSNQYLIGLQAHFSYWNNKDMLWRMVDQLEKALN